jgi:hypothetical protein
MKQTLFAALVALLFVHCSKSKDDTNTTAPEETIPFANCLVTRTERDGFEPHIFSYDAQKRLIKHQYAGYENVLTYNGSTVINTQPWMEIHTTKEPSPPTKRVLLPI